MHPCKILHLFVWTVFRWLLSLCSCECIAFVFDVGAVRFSLKESANSTFTFQISAVSVFVSHLTV